MVAVLANPKLRHLETVIVNLAAASARRVTRNGRQYFVAPLVLIVPGVLNGSQGPLYYPPEEIAADPSIWNGMPLTIYHPTDQFGNPTSARDGSLLDREVGRVLNARVDKRGRLVAEGWFDVEATRRVDPRVLSSLEAGSPIELSTGLFTRNDTAPPGSAFNGRSYSHVARAYRPDHVAVLPDQVGACSRTDGCGVLVNQFVPILNKCGCKECKKGKKCKCKAHGNEEGYEGKTPEVQNNDGWEPITNRRKKKQPSDKIDMSPSKACKILHDGETNGTPLTEKQRGMFGALCGKRKPTSNGDGAMNFEDWYAENCGGPGSGRPGPCPRTGGRMQAARGGGSPKKRPSGSGLSGQAARSLEKHGKVRLESDDKDGGKSRLVIRKEKGRYVSTHFSQFPGEEGFTRSEGFDLGSAKKMTASQAVFTALKHFGKADRVLNEAAKVPASETSEGWLPLAI